MAEMDWVAPGLEAAVAALVVPDLAEEEVRGSAAAVAAVAALVVAGSAVAGAEMAEAGTAEEAWGAGTQGEGGAAAEG